MGFLSIPRHPLKTIHEMERKEMKFNGGGKRKENLAFETTQFSVIASQSISHGRDKFIFELLVHELAPSVNVPPQKSLFASSVLGLIKLLSVI